MLKSNTNRLGAMGQTTTSIKLDDALKARLQALAAAHRRSVHWLMREAITEYVEREERGIMGAPEVALAPIAQPPVAKSKEAYEWLAQLEAKGVSVKPPKRRS